MKSMLCLLSLFTISCSHPCSDSEGFEADTVHVADGHHVKLMKIPKEKLKVNKSAETEPDYRGGLHSFGSHGVDLGMGSVPVLDQGAYGTCVTFASTAALDAIYNLGDGISQQCFLELSKGLGNDIWNGAYYPSEVIDPMAQYGAVLKDKCPRSYPDANRIMSIAQYKALGGKSIADVQYKYTARASLAEVKAALARGHRVLTGFQLRNSSLAVTGFNVKVDGRQYSGGLWACKQGSSANLCGSAQAGHEVIIIGYDDDQKLLKIRNSWSEVVGEQGNYYMSYRYFESMAMDQTEVWGPDEEDDGGGCK